LWREGGDRTIADRAAKGALCKSKIDVVGFLRESRILFKEF